MQVKCGSAYFPNVSNAEDAYKLWERNFVKQERATT